MPVRNGDATVGLGVELTKNDARGVVHLEVRRQTCHGHVDCGRT